MRASDNLANEFVVRLFGVAQGDGGAAWAAASERARVLHFARKNGSSDSAADSDPASAAALGSRGITLGLLCADVLASHICGEPLPIDPAVAHLLRPHRFKKSNKPLI